MITDRRNGIGRLTGETRTGTNPFTASYTVDGAGNRTSQTIGGTTTNFTLNIDDELTATTGGFANSYSYNANGEQTGRTLAGTAYSLSFDYDGQLTQITQGGNTTSFAYDALGRRYSRTAGGTTTQFHYAGSAVLQEKQGGTTTGVYSYGNGLLRRGGEHPLFDGSGSERTVTNSGQSVTGSINFEAFGQTAGSSGSSSSPYMFAGNWGYRTEGDAGLMKVGARYYDAQVGRFITRDSYLDQHPYLYCEHEPVGLVDPSGYKPSLEWCFGMAAAIMDRNWDEVELLIEIIIPELPEELRRALEAVPIPNKGVLITLPRIPPTQGDFNTFEKHLKQIAIEGPGGQDYHKHITEIAGAWR